jgi:prepilin-type N-terminal cleavage/methylation domain-containing protein
MVLRRLRVLDERGFSLTDLLITLVVMGIIAAIAWPYFDSFLKASRVKGGAQELATIINGARQLAIARNTIVCMVLESNKAKYMLNTSAACIGGTTYLGPVTKADGTIALANSMHISGTTANVVFTNLGNASTAATYTVRDPATNQTLRVVVAASGRVTIQ